MRNPIALLALGALLLLGACSAFTRGSAMPFGAWSLVELEGTDPSRLARPAELTLDANGTVSGFGGVNRFSGRADAAALEAGRLEAGPLMATLMAGPPEAMEVEHHLLALLGTPLEWKRRGDELVLSRDGVVRARLRAVRD